MIFDISKIQQALAQERFDGWLFYNFHNIDPSANNILSISNDKMLTRRWFYFVPQKGEPTKLVHRIESGALDHLPGQKQSYAGWKQLHHELWNLLKSFKRIAMQYSPMCAIPYVSYVDAGTVELIRSTGVEVHSSANLIQTFEAVWTQKGIESHELAGKILHKIVEDSFAYVAKQIRAKNSLTEYQVQQFILQEFNQHGLVYDHPPIVAVNEHSGDPHYEPGIQGSSQLKEGDLLLIDLWAKFPTNESVYADITWCGDIATTIVPRHAEIFEIVRQARDAAVQFIRDGLAAKRDICGYQVDDVSRQLIEKAGYGKYFVHRTGHSLGSDLHWKGVNMDDFETRDERKIIEGIGFSIEPGIYLPEFGIRSEINVYIHQGQAKISALPSQTALIPILAEGGLS